MENYDGQYEYGWVLLGVHRLIVRGDITGPNYFFDHVDYQEETLVGWILSYYLTGTLKRPFVL